MTSFAPAPPARVSRHRVSGVLAVVGRLLIIAGIVVLLFVAYELWGTNIREARAQDDLRAELDDRFAAVGVPAASSSESDADPGPAPAGGDDDLTEEEILALFLPPEGEAVARVQIPDIGVDKVVVRGVDVADLRKGPGHYPSSAPPGTTGNSSIAGHRTTYGAPFNRIDELTPGDEILVTSVQGTFTYRVMDATEAFTTDEEVDSFGEGHVIVRPGAVWVLEDFGDDRLTLTACHPKLSSRQRIIVAAELVTEPAAVPVAVLDARPSTTDSPDVDADAEGAAAEDLDQGLNGEQEAIPGAVLWLAIGAAVWFVGGFVGRRLDRGFGMVVACRAVALVPAAFCLWFAFDGIDRALPAG